MLCVGWMDGMVFIGHRSSKSTFGAKNDISPHQKVCTKFQGELAVTESEEDYKRCILFSTMLVPKLLMANYFKGGRSSLPKAISSMLASLYRCLQGWKEKLGSYKIVCLI